MPTVFRVVVARIRGAFRSTDLDRDFDQELETHLAMAEEHNVRSGMTRAQARRAARVELGGLTQLREASREARGLPWLGTLWLDVKLALRMLRKSWGLTLVGGLAMTIVIFVAAGAFSFLDALSGSTVPLDDGERVVALQTWDAAAGRARGTSLLDFERWRDALRSVEDVGAFRTVRRGVITADVQAEPVAGGAAEPVSIAEMTASGFQLARVPPLLGRPLVEDDERDSAGSVVVIGYDVWQSRFAADPAVVGRRVRLDGTVHTVVGVMPEDFAFPVNHGFWTPLRADPSRAGRSEGPAVVVFARLAPGVTLERAQAELTTVGLLPPVTVAETTEQLQPRLLPYAQAFVYIDPWVSGLIQILVALLLVPPCANIAILVYARTITRQEEFAARYALGASRGRIVGQLFVEVLVLAVAAAAVALVLAGLTVGQARVGITQSPGATPFWMDFGLSVSTVIYVAGLAVLAAMIAGALPALQATGRLMQSGLRALGGRTGMRLGTTWTALVVAQIALSVAVLPSAAELAWGLLRPGILGPGFPAEQYLTARLEMDEIGRGVGRRLPRPIASRFTALQAELVRRLEGEPGVLEVTVLAAVPGDEPQALVEIDGVPVRPISLSSGHEVSFLQVDEVFFDVFDVQLLAGRRFDTGDLSPERAAVIVNQTLAQDIAAYGSPLGRQVRYYPQQGVEGPSRARTENGPVSASRPWFEIVGVVADLPANRDTRMMYHLMVPGQMHPVSLALRMGPGQATVVNRVQEITTALDPTVGVDALLRLDDIYLQQQEANAQGAFALAVVTLSVLLLSAAGLYALMSFTVNQRRREIGIRSALGAQPRRLLGGIFKRAAGQVGVGAAVGILAAVFFDFYLPVEELGAWNVPAVVPAAAALMIVVGLLSAVGPARRGLRVDPTEALRDG
jgi:predicted permease